MNYSRFHNDRPHAQGGVGIQIYIRDQSDQRRSVEDDTHILAGDTLPVEIFFKANLGHN